MIVHNGFCYRCNSRLDIGQTKIGNELWHCCDTCCSKSRKNLRLLPGIHRGQSPRLRVRQQPASLPGQLPLFDDCPIK